MATPTEHYQQAERLLARAESIKVETSGFHGDTTNLIATLTAFAQAHATLADAGATGLANVKRRERRGARDAWLRVTSVTTNSPKKA